MKKQFQRRLCALLALCMLLTGLSMPAAALTGDEEVLQALALLSIMNGDENGELHLEQNVTRAAFAKMCIAASAYKDQGALPSGIAPFPDVPAKHWAAGYISVACDAGWFFGDLNGYFRPNDGITLAEAVTVALRMLGYGPQSFTAQWPNGQMERCYALKLNEGIAASVHQKLTRMECARLIYNLLSTERTDGVVYCTALGHTLDADGEIDVLALMDKELDGPVVMTGSEWLPAVGFVPKRLYLDGREAALSEISPYHVVYYQTETATVFAYSGRHTGTIAAIGPNADQPQTVTLGGATYPIGSAQAARSLSSQGQFRVGDPVTLLMGRGGQVAAVVAGDTLSQTVYAVVIDTGLELRTTASGQPYQVDYIDVIATDGAAYRYEAEDDLFKAGDLVQIYYGGEGRTVRRLNTVTLSGTVKNGAVGGVPLAADARIIDVWEEHAVTVPASRLEGCTLTKDDVRYAAYDEAGQATDLILDDYTGDLYSYGILREVQKAPTGAITFVSYYTCLFSGTEIPFAVENTAYPAQVGGIQALYTAEPNAAPELLELRSLEKVTVRDAGGTWISGGGRRHTVSDAVQAYVRRDGQYYLSSWDLVRDLDAYTLTAWYDDLDSAGGRVRVVTAVEK